MTKSSSSSGNIVITIMHKKPLSKVLAVCVMVNSSEGYRDGLNHREVHCLKESEAFDIADFESLDNSTSYKLGPHLGK